MTKTAKPAANPNLRHWEALGTTDPAHTKPFQKAGGFRGTAVRPIESVRRMTEHFGPCGIGWGMGKPEFEIVPVEGNGELLVFCTISLWYMDGPGDERANSLVWGVGGDKVVAKGTSGLRTSDEAYKSAYTDALSNAMKHIGVAADVHMGRFDDSKYVAETRAEFASQAGTPPDPSGNAAELPLHLQAYNEAAKGSGALRAFWSGLQNEDRQALCRRLNAPLRSCPQSLKERAEQADAKARPVPHLVDSPHSADDGLVADKVRDAVREMLDRSLEAETPP
jgi:hypothetical protein